MTAPASTPRQALWAGRLWLASGVVLVVTAIWALVVGILNTSAFFVGIAVVSVAAGAATVVLGRRAGLGDPRWRSTVAVLTLVVTILGMLLAVLLGIPFVLIGGLLGLVGSMLAYRPAAEPWFTEKRA
ncbi:hypothetical protein [Williamsia deligens]|uniref:Uncharacterized protein n=1 Tax=Williamsia deligens TaxID=321325 RepID=A0ABW3G7E2_9NOCA|nr:hypothetical protein [Williamsia deligens]MCP2194443.1 hypothetical protein [Williamsia deligens]